MKFRWLIWTIFLAPPTLAIAVAIHWVYFTAPVITPSKTDPWALHLESTTVEPGEELVATFYSCKTDEIVGTWSRTILDEVEWNLVSDSSRLPIGCGMHAIVQQVPEALPDGVYKLAVNVQYSVNPLKEQHFRFISGPFTVKRQGIPLATQRIVIVPKWSQERDKEFRKRIQQLEEWRMRMEGKHD